MKPKPPVFVVGDRVRNDPTREILTIAEVDDSSDEQPWYKVAEDGGKRAYPHEDLEPTDD